MSKALIYIANVGSNQATLATGSKIKFGSVVRRFGCAIKSSMGNPVVEDSGYYTAFPNVTFTAGGAGTVLVRVLQDGNEIPGATANLTVADATRYSVAFPAPFRTFCCQQSTITVEITGVATTINSASIEVVKE